MRSATRWNDLGTISCSFETTKTPEPPARGIERLRRVAAPRRKHGGHLGRADHCKPLQPTALIAACLEMQLSVRMCNDVVGTIACSQEIASMC